MEICQGATRRVFLLGEWAIKVPNFFDGWLPGIMGLKSNMQERDFTTLEWRGLCPVLFSFWGGWLVIMKRARPLSDEEWSCFQPQLSQWLVEKDGVIPAEMKRSSFGVLSGRVVCVDYG